MRKRNIIALNQNSKSIIKGCCDWELYLYGKTGKVVGKGGKGAGNRDKNIKKGEYAAEYSV